MSFVYFLGIFRMCCHKICWKHAGNMLKTQSAVILECYAKKNIVSTCIAQIIPTGVHEFRRIPLCFLQKYAHTHVLAIFLTKTCKKKSQWLLHFFYIFCLITWSPSPCVSPISDRQMIMKLVKEHKRENRSGRTEVEEQKISERLHV